MPHRPDEGVFIVGPGVGAGDMGRDVAYQRPGKRQGKESEKTQDKAVATSRMVHKRKFETGFRAKIVPHPGQEG